MILYFNDYKLIYIITMMGKINNIPVLNEDVIRLVVLNEEIIGYIYPRRTSYVVALEIKPGRTTSLATSVNKQCMVLLSDKVRLPRNRISMIFIYALMVSEITLCIVIIRERNLYTFNEIHSPFFWIREGRAFRCPLLFGKRPKKSSKKRLELLVIPLICVHADFFPPSPSSEWLSSFPACP